MKRSLLITAALLLLTIPYVASSQTYFEVGKSYIGPSVGLSFLGSALQYGANYEYGMKMEFGMVGIGGVFRYWGYSEDFGFFGGGGKWKYTNILIGAQGNYHFKMDAGSKIDPWAGVILGYDASSVKWDGPSGNFASPTSGGLVLNAQGGARYWFSHTMAVRASIGYGSMSYGALDFGIDFKL